MIDALVDTAVFVYAVGGAHPYRQPCRDVLASAVGGRWQAAISPDVVQEFLYQRARRTGDRLEAVSRAREIPVACTVLDLTSADARRALDLFEAHPGLHARDAVFAAVALERQIARILSPDRAFDAVAGLLRVDPLDAVQVAALTG